MSLYDYQATARYVQYEHALQEIRRYTFGLGQRFLVVTACGPITEQMTAVIKDSFTSPMTEKVMPEIAKKNPRYNRQIAEAKRFDEVGAPEPTLIFHDLEGYEVTEKAIQDMAETALAAKVDVVIGVGGGKALDFSRAIAYHTNIKCVLVPTAASTNAAATQLFIINNEEGTKQVGCLFLANYPSLVLVDTSVLIQTPAASLAAGIADQMCSYYECLYSGRRLGVENEHSPLCWDVARHSIDLLYACGKDAVEAAGRHEINRAYETAVSLVLHNNGLARSISGSGFSHLLAKGLVAFPACRKQASHGMQVAYGIIPMMVAEGEPEETIHKYLDFCMDLGLPVNLEMIGLVDLDLTELKEALVPVCNPSAELPFTPETMVDCVRRAEELTAAYLKGKAHV